MDITTIIGVGIIGTILAVTVKSYRPEMGLLISVATGIVIFLSVASGLADILSYIQEICRNAGVDTDFFRVVIKVIAIAYTTQFATELARDAGEGAIGKKLELAGKTLILVSLMPVVKNLLDVIVNTLMNF